MFEQGLQGARGQFPVDSVNGCHFIRFGAHSSFLVCSPSFYYFVLCFVFVVVGFERVPTWMVVEVGYRGTQGLNVQLVRTDVFWREVPRLKYLYKLTPKFL